MTAIYGRIGVNAVWSDRFSSAAERISDVAASTGCDFQLTVMILAAPMTAQIDHPAHHLGFALGFAPRTNPLLPGRVAYVFYDRVEALARSQQVNLARFLGFSSGQSEHIRATVSTAVPARCVTSVALH